MPIIFGWGKKKIEELGEINARKCGRCGNEKPWRIIKVTIWFTLFFIPVFPYKTHYLLSCPICGDALEMEKQAYKDMVSDFESKSQK
ncbi:zinc-ribbon domain-containing protein [Candidatus Dojkabacteria bacterium]|uniref:Zinc-ribbon domain-containing protein n=1 Tax=Candidatus Dojkabacteria bacterium TaxID=2099670 RepID=A0A955L4P8_9BACT|nr:zinc-ribbon domain-containing protein [Candidatus Dojkabacteria bacterium]